jgi:hypothetical protein
VLGGECPRLALALPVLHAKLDQGLEFVRCFAPGWLFVTLHPCKGTAQILWYRAIPTAHNLLYG